MHILNLIHEDMVILRRHIIEQLKEDNERMKKDFDSIDWDYERAEPDIHPDPDSTLKEAKK